MIVYKYNYKGIYLGEVTLGESDKCPITGKLNLPGMTTNKKPLETKEGYNIIFNISDRKWEYIKILSENEKKINGTKALEAGEKIVDEFLVKTTAPSEFHSWNFETLEWFFDENKKIQKITKINQKAYQDIIETYPEWKQLNIIRNKDNSLEEKDLFNEMSNFIDNIRKNSNEEIEKLVEGAD